MAKVNTDSVKNQMKQQRQQDQQQDQQQGQEQKPASAGTSIGKYLAGMGPAIRNVLPKHMTPERLARIALGEIRKNPQLLQCEVASLGAAVMQAATLGLEPSVLGHCYFVPFWNKKERRRDVQFIIGYKGYIDLARRSGDVLSMNAMEVRENDEFEFEYGLEEKLRHKPARKDRGAVTHYYAYAKFKDGGHTFLVLSREDIVEHAYKFSKQIDDNNQLKGTWRDHFDSMAKKTVIRAMIKYMPLSIEIQEKFNADERIIKGVKEDGDDITGDIFDMETAALAGEAGEEGEPQEPEQEEQKPAAALEEGPAPLNAEDLQSIEKDLAEARAAQEKINEKKQQKEK